jgi:hypothetical protein
LASRLSTELQPLRCPGSFGASNRAQVVYELSRPFPADVSAPREWGFFFVKPPDAPCAAVIERNSMKRFLCLVVFAVIVVGAGRASAQVTGDQGR